MERTVGLMLLAFSAGAFAQQGQIPAQQQDSSDQEHRYEAGEIDQHQQSQDSMREQRDRAADHHAQASTSSQQGSSSTELQQLASQHEDLSRFVEAMQATGLAQSVRDGEYTAFAPTNDAFDSMDRTFDELMRPENRGQLVELLRNHLVAGKLDRERASKLDQALTVGGGTLDLATENGRLTVNGTPVDDTQIGDQGLIVYSVGQVLDPAGEPGDSQELQAAAKKESWAASDQTRLEPNDEDANEE